MLVDNTGAQSVSLLIRRISHKQAPLSSTNAAVIYTCGDCHSIVSHLKEPEAKETRNSLTCDILHQVESIPADYSEIKTFTVLMISVNLCLSGIYQHFSFFVFPAVVDPLLHFAKLMTHHTGSNASPDIPTFWNSFLQSYSAARKHFKWICSHRTWLNHNSKKTCS